ncbi:glycosyltransferase [Stenotrophomonas acidaminiphila]|uniref:glycosyltransferase family 2 protein n=1 Tax=Stenotrophomonas acidaminiphila TaxID=128780 RepID=UPI0028B18731|nr:glycosyltransferase [Stenotrophomonas acidaminiphila]
MSKPVLSICIPTFNRADMLGLLLENIRDECRHLLDKVEIVVSDNASEDHTGSTVRASGLPVVYHRNPTNIGFSANLLHVTARLASAEYVWVVGDDDLILPGGVARVLDSIARAPDVDYHYVNFGWIGTQLRRRMAQTPNPDMADFPLEHLQCDLREWRRLEQLEDLTALPGRNPSVLFSCIFSFVSRRRFFSEALEWLNPSASLDGSSTHIDDCFPHAMLTLPRVVGRPVAYIGVPCVLQTIGGWEWKAYANKNMIFGIHQFFRWLEGKGFGREGMERLWASYHDMAGRLFSRMQCYQEENKGFDIVMREAIPDAASHGAFWEAFMAETRTSIETDYEAGMLARAARDFVRRHPGARLGLWGIQGRGYRFLKETPDLYGNMVWVADRDARLHGDALEYTTLEVSDPASLREQALDCLVIATRRDFIDEVIATASASLPPGTVFISTNGLSTHEAR